MKKKTLYLLRHSQSVYNKLGIIQGDIDTSLSKEGRNEVKNMAHVFKNFDLQYVVHSPLKRAVETAQIINAELELPTKIKENLKEMDFGKWNAKTKIEEWENFRRNFYEFGEAPPGGETKGELFKRVEKAIHEMCQEVDEDHVLVVAHGMVYRILLGKWFTNDTEKEIRKIKMNNLSLYKVEVEFDADRIVPKSNKYIDIHEL